MELYWWWIQSGSLFIAYLFGCCIIAAMIVYGLNELYLDELDSNDGRLPLLVREAIPELSHSRQYHVRLL